MCKAKQGRRPRVRSMPIDNTYVQVYLANDLQKVVQHGASQTSVILIPSLDAIFVFPKLEPEHRVLCTKKFSKLREWFVIHSFLI